MATRLSPTSVTSLTYVPIRRETPAVLALVRERAAAARLAEALRAGAPGGAQAGMPYAGATLRVVTHIAELHDALAARPYAMIVVEPRDADGVPTEEAIRALRARYPELPVVGHVAAQPGASPDVLALARAGIHELIMAGLDDVAHVLRNTLARAVRRSTAERVLTGVMPLVPPAAVPVLRYCLEHATAAPDVPALARALGVSRQTLATRMRAAGLPGPRALSVWCRLLIAAELLAGDGRSVDQVALTLDFPSANAFRNLLRRYADLGPADLRRDHGAALRAAFHDALAGRRPHPADALDAVGVHATVGADEDGLVPS